MLHLYEIPLILALVGLAFYVVLGGADFGTGWWQLTAGRGPHAAAIRDHAHAAIAPVWEANHVWLIFVLTVVWTAYPVAFGSIASTLSIPLFIAAVGIIFRGTAYALRAGASGRKEVRTIDLVFSLSSVLTPFALGAAVGGIASRRVPVGNAAGSQFSSWLNPTSILIGLLAVASAAYLAGVFLCADAARLKEPELESRFRKRALAAGLVAGALALAGLPVLQTDAHPLFHGLVAGAGLPALVLSLLAGIGTLFLVWRKRYEPARYGAAVAVAAIIAGWALAQSPVFLDGLTIQAAAAPRNTLVVVIVAVFAGGAVLFPSLALLFRLVLSGRLGYADDAAAAPTIRRRIVAASAPGLLARVAVSCLFAGIGLLAGTETGWTHALGVASLLAFIVFAFPTALPPDLGNETKSGDPPARRGG
jgi:cytochrome d ubiquinol oxidase subunit II